MNSNLQIWVGHPMQAIYLWFTMGEYSHRDDFNPAARSVISICQYLNQKKIVFGAAGYSDFTKHTDEKGKQRYIKRNERKRRLEQIRYSYCGVLEFLVIME